MFSFIQNHHEQILNCFLKIVAIFYSIFIFSLPFLPNFFDFNNFFYSLTEQEVGIFFALYFLHLLYLIVIIPLQYCSVYLMDLIASKFKKDGEDEWSETIIRSKYSFCCECYLNHYYSTIFYLIHTVILHLIVIGTLSLVLLAFSAILKFPFQLISNISQILTLITITLYFIFIYCSPLGYNNNRKMNNRSIFISLSLLGMFTMGCHVLGYYTIKLLFSDEMDLSLITSGFGFFVALSASVALMVVLFVCLVILSIFYKIGKDLRQYYSSNYCSSNKEHNESQKNHNINDKAMTPV